MSMGMSRAGILPSYEDIRIEEFINYHRHLLPLPENNQRVALDLRWNKLVNERADSINTASIYRRLAWATTSTSSCSEKADKRLKQGIKFAQKHFAKGGDADVARVVDIAKDYRDRIKRWRQVRK